MVKLRVCELEWRERRLRVPLQDESDSTPSRSEPFTYDNKVGVGARLRTWTVSVRMLMGQKP
jgi:hypothetical protein